MAYPLPRTQPTRRWFVLMAAAIVVTTVWLRALPTPPATPAPSATPQLAPQSIELVAEPGGGGSGQVWLGQSPVGVTVGATATLAPPLPDFRYSLWVSVADGTLQRLGSLTERAWGSYELAAQLPSDVVVSEVLLTLDREGSATPGRVVLRGRPTARPAVDPVIR